ncbi:MAG: hypothetical protein ACRC6V_02135 [Bacteroidales bacterium]
MINRKRILNTTKQETHLTGIKTMNAYTTKAKEMNITAFAIKGVRWFQKTYGNTYHSTYISALVNGKWQDIGSTEVQYGYGDHYMHTAGTWLIENGFIEVKDGYAFNGYQFCQDNAIEHFATDVQRKRDL